MLRKLISLVLSVFLLTPAFANGGAGGLSVEMLGKKKGKINSVEQGGQTFVEALPMAKLLKFQTTLFGRSGQLNIRGQGGYFAVLRSAQRYAVVKGINEDMGCAPFMQNGRLYAPLSFFSKGSPAKASGFQTMLDDGKIIIEKFYTISFDRVDETKTSAKIIFDKASDYEEVITPRGKKRVDIFLPDAIIKREETIKPKSEFIESIRTAQRFQGVSLNVFLKKEAKFWDINKSGQTFVFEASSKEITKQVVAQKTALEPSKISSPSVLNDKAAEQTNDKETILGDEFFASSDTQLKSAASISSASSTIKAKIPPPTVSFEKRPSKKNRKARIVIDPGHGGKDPGAVRRGSAKEKDLNYQVADLLYDLLKKDKSFEVRMTRGENNFETLGGRAKMANNFKADIFVSIHTNAAKRSSANGFEVYFRSDKASDAEAAETAALENEALQYEGKSAATVSFADLLLKSLATNEYMNESSKIAGHIRNAVAKNSSSIGIKVHQNSGIKQANFYVLKGVEAPSVLVEMGYISNPKDRARLNNKSARAKMAASIRDGIVSYAKAEGWK
ncbi:MAG: N-acetylmuramoyl-L-alanine amidase [Elusimicrobiota bacterium]|jgi:N-acetylmuramoyl-L-alanine amidase|nr:N-acetylmuramoyl-L-alanine amidase [Elusimicrobiota bacterium]